MTRKGLLFFSH